MEADDVPGAGYGDHDADCLGDSKLGAGHGCQSTGLQDAVLSDRIQTPSTSLQHGVGRSFSPDKDNLRMYCDSLRRQIEDVVVELRETKSKVQALEQTEKLRKGSCQQSSLKAKL